MEKIPTAEECSKNYALTERYGQSAGHIDYHEIYSFARAFARLHVRAALEAASIDAKIAWYDTKLVDKDSILNAYPLENIK